MGVSLKASRNRATFFFILVNFKPNLFPTNIKNTFPPPPKKKKKKKEKEKKKIKP